MIDIQSGEAKTPFAIESVGILNLVYPIVIKDRVSGEVQSTSATWRMGVALPAERRGTHMSRFIAELEAAHTRPFDLDEHFRFALHVAARLDAAPLHSCDISAKFAWFRTVKAPVSGLASHLVSELELKSKTGDHAEKAMRVTVSAKSLCPCSKAISDRGAHNQRSDITVELAFAPDAVSMSPNRVLELIEQCASSPVYPLLKREDEKHVTEHAYDHPVFVEDLVRNIASRLHDLPDITRFEVEAINRESIHAHDAYARIRFTR